jgi:hypothetical protein
MGAVQRRRHRVLADVLPVSVHAGMVALREGKLGEAAGAPGEDSDRNQEGAVILAGVHTRVDVHTGRYAGSESVLDGTMVCRV